MKKGIFILFAAGVFLTIISLRVVAQKGKMVPQRITFAEIPWPKSVSNQAGSAMRPGLDDLTDLLYQAERESTPQLEAVG